MKQLNFYIVFTAFLLVHLSVNAQGKRMTLDETVELALKNNYDIAITKNLALQAKNSNSLGNAGMLPRLDINSSGTLANNATKQEFSNGLSINKTGVQSKNIATGAYLTWTVFDGFKMFATHERLQQLEHMGELNVKVQIENTLVKVINAYYNVVMQKQIINGLKENISVSEERLKIAQKKFDIGTTSKADVLQAKIDLNTLKTTLIRQTNLLSDAKANLNQLLIQPVEQEFDVLDDIPQMPMNKYEELQNAILNNNSDILFAQRNVDVAKYMIKEGQSNLYPKLNLNANYIFSRVQNQAGLSLLNQNLGLNLGFTLSWTVFNGFTNVNTIKNLQLNLQKSMYDFDNLKMLTQLNLLKAFRKNQDDLAVLKLQDETKVIAKENLDLALERFRLGAATSIDIKMAQQSYEDAITKLADARYNAKVSETQLLKLTGGIIK